MRYLALGIDGETDGLKTLQLYLEKAFNHIILPDGRYLDGYFDLSPLFLSYLESNLFEVFKSFVTSYRKHILVQIIELCIVTAGDHPKHERIGSMVFNYIVFEANGDIKLFNRSWE